ncbi:formate dehydrogenase accessory sulfurtransferase FdhD [Jeotgalibacillus haloalkalitolerans]|uniref:Sulfur carrier protein FdhD n=1 Tax=Jeotgalibacillus haloalkalitolerans TaxID=3104292 RepID=A0ABU5KQ70_9BACL|nr:formate dehydrogenase accessory sulfurtransferase FdhD [Jeotgalibacillus sp. HH7-29]MDZ5713297.1 formate dehydrogenase accessory sulfurtransferase FdhD [Jeotgalibacillus sp. HH7-29]
MSADSIKKRKILRVADGEAKWVEDTIVTEQVLTIKLNGEEFVTVVCSPEYMEDLAVGYLASEGVIRSEKDISSIRLDSKGGFIHVTAEHLNPLYDSLQNKRYITSCCGGSRQGFVFASDAMTAKKMTEQNVKLHPDQCFHLMQKLQQSALTFKETGGVHNAALCTEDEIVLSRMDIGRHNALDKIYGHCLRQNISVKNKVIVFSGRLSSEILLKVAKIGCEMVISKSAPTERALELAEELNMTTVGFVRGNSFNVYTCPERIILKEASLN